VCKSKHLQQTSRWLRGGSAPVGCHFNTKAHCSSQQGTMLCKPTHDDVNQSMNCSICGTLDPQRNSCQPVTENQLSFKPIQAFG
jgi:hypothetical protein